MKIEWESLFNEYEQGVKEPLLRKIDSGLYLDEPDESRDGNTPLLMACQRNMKKITECLINKNVDINIQNQLGQTALTIACGNQNVELAMFLLKRGANVNTQDMFGMSPLCYAIMRGQTELVKLIVDSGYSVKSQDAYGYNPLMKACMWNRKEVAEFLIEQGADVNRQDGNGFTALSYACSKGDFNMVRLLCEQKAQVNLANNNGKTALFIASQKGHLECVNFLIKNGANVHMKCENHSSPLRIAYCNQHDKIVSFLSCVLIQEFYEKIKELVGNFSIEKVLSDSIENEEMFLIRSDHIEVFKLLISDKRPNTIYNLKKIAHLEYFLSFEFREFLTENIIKWLKNEKMQLIISKIKVQESLSNILISSFKSDSNESQADNMKYFELKQLLKNEYLELINSEQSQELKLIEFGKLMNKIEHFLIVVSKYLSLANDLFDVLTSGKIPELIESNFERNDEHSQTERISCSKVIFY